MRDGGSFQRTSKVTRIQPSYLPAVLSCEKHSLLGGPARNCRHSRLLGRATKGRLCAGGLRPYPLFSTRKLSVWGSRWCLARGGVWLEVVFASRWCLARGGVCGATSSDFLGSFAPPRDKTPPGGATSRQTPPRRRDRPRNSRPGLGELGAADVRGEEIIRSCYFLRRILEAAMPRTPVPAMAAIALLARSASPVFGVASFLVSFFASFFSSFFGSA